MRRLWLRVYLAIIALLVVMALVAGALLHPAEERAGMTEAVAELALGALPPAQSPSGEQLAVLQRWGARLRSSFTLYGADGGVIASTVQPPLPIEVPRRYGPPRGWSVPMADGRTLVAAREQVGPGPVLGTTLFMLLLALAVAAGAWPAVRRLTRRLERLKTSVEALGSGDLSARVPVEGRDEVAALAQSFNQSAARIEALVAANRSLLANASHELRSPLARIRMAVELLEQGARPGLREELARDIAELDALIGEILLASRLDAGQGANDVVEDCDLLALAAEEAARVGAVLEVRSPASMVRGDPKLLRRLLRNLLENARRHGGEGVIDIAVGQGEGADRLRVEVADRGPGVPDTERERVFEPFYRIRGASESAGGVGLGLSLVRQIAHRHGGKVRCLAREGGGSVFRVDLPRSR